MKALIKKSSKLCTIFLIFKPIPTNLLTPVFPVPFVRITINMSVNNIKNFILSKLNLQNYLNNQNIIELYINDSQNKPIKIDHKCITILDILQRYWKDYRGVVLFEKKNILNALKICNHT